jgi:hypothetical protein
MNNFLSSIIGKILRWVLFLPIALASLVAVKLIIAWLRYDAWSEYMIEIIPTHIIANGVSFYASVMIVFYVVPHFKKIIAIIFASILIISLSYNSIVSFDSISLLPKSGDIVEISLLGIISSIIGAAWGVLESIHYKSE